MRRWARRSALGGMLGLALLGAGEACAQRGSGATPAPAEAQATLVQCAAVVDDRQRLACYDALAKPRAQATTPSQPLFEPVASAPPAPASELERQWELRPDLRQGTFRLLPYEPIYALVHGTTNVNQEPSTPTRGPPVRDIRLDRVEAKVQLSFKTKLAQDIAGTGTDAWFGYTQQSYWQAANSRYSSPFRETNYRPEAIVLHPLSLALGDVHARYAALSFMHESNGRGESLSRSWNRVVGDLAFESGPWSVHLRPWAEVFRPSEERDDNPDIADYIGRGELVVEWRANGQVVTLAGRHTLRGGDRARGSARLDWAFPLSGKLNGHLQLFSGYGESLIDYNHRQTTLGFGVSFFD